MNSKGFFGQFFTRKQDKKNETPFNVPDETPVERNPSVERIDIAINGANSSRLHRSRSGRLKENKMRRLVVARDTFVAPDNVPQSAPAMSANSMDMYLTGRELTKLESVRMSNSLQFFTKLSSSEALPSSDASSSERENSDAAYDCLDDNEVF